MTVLVFLLRTETDKSRECGKERSLKLDSVLCFLDKVEIVKGKEYN